MVKTINIEQFLSNSEAVILDIRTPAEYELGHIPGALNLPLFTNEERVVVGTLYKQVGREEAIEKGLEFVGPKLAGFVREAKRVGGGRELYLYCWRGGMRSGSMAWLLSTAGLDVKLLKGGYKTYRRSFDVLIDMPWRFISVAGHTGSGKTELLHKIESKGYQMLDLEGLANHKGSVFGGMGKGDQPTTETFINLLHEKMRSFDPSKPIFCEAESMLIGSVFIPQNMFDKLVASETVRVSMPQEQRVERLMVEYGDFDPQMLKDALQKIKKRLGENNVQEANEAIERGDIATAIAISLRYYDKGYEKSTSKRSGKELALIEISNDDMESAADKIIEVVK